MRSPNTHLYGMKPTTHLYGLAAGQHGLAPLMFLLAVAALAATVGIVIRWRVSLARQ